MDTDLSNPEEVVAILRNATGHPLCDNCIRDLSGIRNRIAVNPITHALSLTREKARLFPLRQEKAGDARDAITARDTFCCRFALTSGAHGHPARSAET